jgi:hypothetical protein
MEYFSWLVRYYYYEGHQGDRLHDLNIFSGSSVVSNIITQAHLNTPRENAQADSQRLRFPRKIQSIN